MRKKEITGRIAKDESRNSRFCGDEVIKLDRWRDDLEQGLEREIKHLDEEIREARKVVALAASLKNSWSCGRR